MVYLIELPDKRKVQKEPMAAPKWKGRDRCRKIDKKYGS